MGGLPESEILGASLAKCPVCEKSCVGVEILTFVPTGEGFESEPLSEIFCPHCGEIGETLKKFGKERKKNVYNGGGSDPEIQEGNKIIEFTEIKRRWDEIRPGKN